MSHVEHECRKDVCLPWSKEIHAIMTQIHILRIHLSSLKNKIDCEVQINAKQKSLKVKQHLPESIKDTTKLPKSAQKDVRTIWKEYQSRRTTLVQDQEEAYIASCLNMYQNRHPGASKSYILPAQFSPTHLQRNTEEGVSQVSMYPFRQLALNLNTRQ